jgi:cell division GTPase FtsZ
MRDVQSCLIHICSHLISSMNHSYCIIALYDINFFKQDAAVGAICSPLLDYPIAGASGIIFNIVGGPDMTLQEVSAAAQV